jgi:hypothetical protein
MTFSPRRRSPAAISGPSVCIVVKMTPSTTRGRIVCGGDARSSWRVAVRLDQGFVRRRRVIPTAATFESLLRSDSEKPGVEPPAGPVVGDPR